MIFHFDEFDIARHITDQDWHLTTNDVVGCHGIYDYIRLGRNTKTTLTCRTETLGVSDHIGWFIVNYGAGSMRHQQYNQADYETVHQCIICYGKLIDTKIHIMDNPDNISPMVYMHQPEVTPNGIKASKVRVKYYDDVPWLPRSVDMNDVVYDGDISFNGGVITWNISDDAVPEPRDQRGYSIGDFQKYNAFNPKIPDEITRLHLLNSNDPSMRFRIMTFGSRDRK